MSKLEELTEEERRWLESDPEFQKWDVRRKTLRIIDAHAADRAALVARVAELEREIERLTCIPCDADKRVAESECATLRQRLEVAERAKAEWERVRNEAYALYREEASKRESETAALRAENERKSTQYETAFRERAEAEAALQQAHSDRAALVARVAELEAEAVALDAAHRRMLDERNEWQDAAAAYLDEGCTRWEAAEQQLAAANARLAQCLRDLETDPHAEDHYAGLIDDLRDDLRAHFAEQVKPVAVECNSCAMRGRDCDGGEEADAHLSARRDSK